MGKYFIYKNFEESFQQIDQQKNLDDHVNSLCKKASGELRALSRVTPSQYRQVLVPVNRYWILNSYPKL